MAKKQEDKRARLERWQDRLASNDSAYSGEVARMGSREALYQGDPSITKIVAHDSKAETPHVRNICAELIESMVSTDIPQPKVTPKRQEDEGLAKLIEDMVRNELDRMPMEQINDLMERIVPIQGGGAYLVEWDNTSRTARTIGDVSVTPVHPRQIVPQDGVYTGIEDMDYVIVKIPQTKQSIRQAYGVDVRNESEEEPDIRGQGDDSTAADIVTQYVAYYRNHEGGIGLFSWVGDTILADLDDYQARRMRRCRKCGMTEPAEDIAPMDEPSLDGTPPEGDETAEEETPRRKRRVEDACPYCGANTWEDVVSQFEEVYQPIYNSDGVMVSPGAVEQVVGYGEELDVMTGQPIPMVEMVPDKIPYYTPNVYPLVLQKNISVYGKFLGDSDIDRITSQQNTTNRIEAKIIDKLVKSGSKITLPVDAGIQDRTDDMDVIRLDKPGLAEMVGVYNLQGDISQDLTYLGQVYEEGRQVLGITDSYQGRKDTTATSAVAKEFAAQQSAGRLESKKVLKEAAYSKIFELIFKFRLAYTDENRPVSTTDYNGNPEYETFSRWDFLEPDGEGGYRWNDDFLFSCDTSAPLASNRESMWQECRMNLETGAFGNPAETATLVIFWGRMELLHYPGASAMKAIMAEKQQKEEQEKAMMMQMQQQQQAMQAGAMMGGAPGGAPPGMPM